jgi:hypothetical protein
VIVDLEDHPSIPLRLGFGKSTILLGPADDAANIAVVSNFKSHLFFSIAIVTDNLYIHLKDWPAQQVFPLPGIDRELG